METVLQAKNMTKIYGMGSKQPFTALENIDLEIKTGEFIVVMGPSGSGKSTLVNNISTIDIPTNGSLYILNQEVKQMSENQLGKFRYQYLGFVFQNYNLLNSLTIYENIMIPLKLIGEDKKVIDEKVHQITKELDIESLLNKYPHECSGGQQQRVAIARALIGNPKIIIADEPTGNLDSQNSHEILSIFKKMNENHITIIMVSHDPLIASYSSRLLYLKDGKIEKELFKGDKTQQEYFKEMEMIYMGFNIYIFIIAVIIVGLYFYMNKNEEKKHEEKRYDLIVIFKEEKYTDIRNNESLNQLANWSYYSKKAFRGFCLQTKEELEGTIIQELALEKDDFEVINGDPELYVPS